MLSVRDIGIAALLVTAAGCGPRYDPPPPFASTRALAGHAPTFEGVTHVQLLPSPSPAVMFGPWTVRAPDSVAALTAFLQQRDSAWRAERPDSTDLVFDLYRVDFYRGGDLVATLTARDTHLGIEGEFGKFEQSISVDEFARLNALLGVGVEVVPVPPRESSR